MCRHFSGVLPLNYMHPDLKTLVYCTCHKVDILTNPLNASIEENTTK